jgi:hypothetical protein
MESWLR